MTKQYNYQDRDKVFLFGDGKGKVTWQLANPIERITAIILNGMLGALSVSPLAWEIYQYQLKGTEWGFRTLGLHLWEYVIVAVMQSDMGKIGLLGLLLYFAFQAILMSLTGQSLGKKLVGIRVITLQTRKAGFYHAVLLREIVFNLVCIFLIGMILMALGLDDNVGAIGLLWLPYVASLSKLSDEQDNCRTPQDKLAGTAVVRANPVVQLH